MDTCLCWEELGALPVAVRQRNVERPGAIAERLNAAAMAVVADGAPLVLVDAVLAEASAAPQAASALRALCVQACEAAVDSLFARGLPGAEHESRLEGLAEHLGLSLDELDGHRAASRMAKARILRELYAGAPPDTRALRACLPVALPADERLLWAQADVVCCEQPRDARRLHARTLPESDADYSPLAPYRGLPVRPERLIFVADGVLAITDRQVAVFDGGTTLRVALRDIAALQPYADGVGLARMRRTARPLVLMGADPWFVYGVLRIALGAARAG